MYIYLHNAFSIHWPNVRTRISPFSLLLLLPILLLLLGCTSNNPSKNNSDGGIPSENENTDPATGDSETNSDAGSSSETDSETLTEICDALDPSVSSEGLIWRDDCEGLFLELSPTILWNNTWLSPAAESCQVAKDQLECVLSSVGTITVESKAGQVSVHFHAEADGTLQAIGLEGELELPGAKGWLSNGFQSWSQSGVISIPSRQKDQDVQSAVRATGETEVYRKGKYHSWWYTYAGGGEVDWFAGVQTASKWSSWAQLGTEDSGAIFVRLASGGRESLDMTSGSTVSGEIWRVEFTSDLTETLRSYGESIETRRTHTARPAPVGWNSWYDLWDNVKQEDIWSASKENNAQIASQILSPLVPEANRPLRIVVDDGWQKAWGDWQPNSKFPLGIDGLALELAKEGLSTGLWLAPLLVAPGADVAKEHPEWLVTGTVYQHAAHGKMHILDVTHPEAAAHLKSLIAEIVSWGVNLLKIDFLFAGTFGGNRYQAVTGIEAYHQALSIIREAAGEEVILLAVGAPPHPSFPYVDGWRSGNDIAFKLIPAFNLPQPAWTFIANQARQFTSRWPMCLSTLCDADPPLLRFLPEGEVEAGAWVAVATGGAVFLSDDLTRLPDNRKDWGLDEQKISIGLGGVPATPEDWYPDEIPAILKNMKDDSMTFTAVHHIPSVWRMPDGTRVGFNFTNGKKIVESIELPKHSARVLP